MARVASPPGRKLDRILLVFCAALLGLTVLYPTGRLLFEAARLWQWEAVLTPPGRTALKNTIVLSFASVLSAGVVGTSFALVLARHTFPGRNILAALAYLPFTLPPLVGVLSFYYLIGRDGLLPRLLQQVGGFENALIPGPWAILIVHTYSFYVFFYAMVGPAVENLDRAQLEAARTLGAGPVRVFWKVTVPLLMPALLGAALLTFMSSGASFSAPYFFGQDYPMLSVVIFNARSQYDHAAAVTLTVVLAGVSLLGVLLFRSRRRPISGGSKGAPTHLQTRAGRMLAGAVAWSLIVLLLLPHLNIVWLSFISYRDWHTEIFPRVFTLGNYAAIFQNASNFAPVWNSLWMSAVATVGVLAVGLPAAYLIARRRRGGRALNVLVMIPWALPGTVIAINLIVAFNDPWLPVYNTIWMLPLAYFVRNVPLLTRMAGAAIEPFDAALLEAGQALGGSRGYCFRRIVLPLIAPATVAAMALVFATSLGEFVASILLYLPGNLPISVKINMEWRADVGVAFAYSVLLMLLVTLTFLLSRRFAARVL